MPVFRIVHLSDLHFTGSPYQKNVIDALCTDLAAIHKKHAINAIVFSGDVFSKGKTDKTNSETVLSNYVSLIRDQVGLSVPVMLCPGNHDVDLTMREQLLEPVFDSIVTPQKADQHVMNATSNKLDAMWNHLSGFRKLAAAIDVDAFSAHPLYYTKIVRAGSLSVGFAMFNSAWLTRGGGTADYGKLLLGDEQVRQATNLLNDVDLRIAVMHHPLEWLSPTEKPVVQRSLAINFQAVLSGHNHDNNAQAISSNIGSLFHSNTGCLYETEDYFNGYSLLTFDPSENSWLVEAREYYFQRRSFDQSPRFSTNGEKKFFVDRQVNAQRVHIPTLVIQAVHDRANSLLLSYSSSDLAPKSIGAIFVEPPLCNVSEKERGALQTDEERDKNKLFSLNEAAAKETSLLLIGTREAGKSLLLHQIAINRINEFHSKARIGFVVDLASLRKQTPSSLLDRAVDFCGGEIPKRDLIALLDAGEVVVCLDNLKPMDSSIISLLKEFVSKYPGCRYIISSMEDISEGLSNQLVPDLGIPLERVFIHSFRKSEARELAKRWFGDNDADLSKRVHTLERLFVSLRIPRTPFLVSVLLWVMEQRPNSHLVNQASAIEVLIDGLLKKLNESKARKDFDSNVQQHFLSEFAAWLDDKDCEWVSAIDFDEYVVNYFKSKGLTAATSGFKHELILKGLIYDAGERVGFKFDCFRAYFLARKFAEVTTRWEKALKLEHVHRYVTELDLFTGLNRDRAQVLLAAMKLCETHSESFKADFSLERIDAIGVDATPYDQKFLDIVEAVVKNADDNTDNSAKAQKQSDSPGRASLDHAEARRRAHLPNANDWLRFMEALRAFSMILRNSELVDDVELKEKCFKLALELWAKVTLFAVVTVADKPSISSGSESKHAMSPEQLRLILRMFIPQFILSVMRDCISTPKLQFFIRQQTKDTRTLVRAFAVFLALDIDDDTAIDLTKSLIHDHRKNAFVIEMTFFRLLYVHISRNHVDAKSEKMRDLLGLVFEEMKGVGQSTTRAKSEFLQRLDRRSGNKSVDD
jgi:predicted MPP superfamily phosphohydrolase